MSNSILPPGLEWRDHGKIGLGIVKEVRQGVWVRATIRTVVDRTRTGNYAAWEWSVHVGRDHKTGLTQWKRDAIAAAESALLAALL